MEIKEFIALMAEQFDDVDVNTLTPETEFKQLDDWSSIVALSIIGMIDDEFGVTIQGKDIHESNTINDLFNVIQNKK